MKDPAPPNPSVNPHEPPVQVQDGGVDLGLIGSSAARVSSDPLMAILLDVGYSSKAEAAFDYLAREAWDHLRAMAWHGFDVALPLRGKFGEETLLHRTVRLHKYDDPSIALRCYWTWGRIRINSTGRD